MELKLFPWDNGEKPYWVNPENKLEWYIDKDITKYCIRDNGLSELDAVCFFVCKREDGKVKPIERVLIDRETNEVLASETSLEKISVKIDMFRMILTPQIKTNKTL